MQENPISQSAEDGIPTEQRRVHAVLYRSYAPALFEYIRHHTAASNDAEDILTEVFIGALRHDLSAMSSDQQRAWLWTVARNKVNDYYRQIHRRPQISLEALRETLEDGTTPELLTLQQEEVAFLHKYLQRLSVVQQEVLQLRFIGGLRCTEIAILLNKREGTIRSILSRAINELRKHYEQ
jgi:RNA polymerase sigma factor (sigma-70 family)